jgi:hypothetical protein
MVFKRSKKIDSSQYTINGTWLFSLNADSGKNYQCTASSSTINICNGTIYKYTVTPPFTITFSLESGSGSNAQLA